MAEKDDAEEAEDQAELELINARVRRELAERCRNAVWWIGRGLTMSSLLEEALQRVVERLEAEHNRGKPFQQRKGELTRSKRKKKKPGDGPKK